MTSLAAPRGGRSGATPLRPPLGAVMRHGGRDAQPVAFAGSRAYARPNLETSREPATPASTGWPTSDVAVHRAAPRRAWASIRKTRGARIGWIPIGHLRSCGPAKPRSRRPGRSPSGVPPLGPARPGPTLLRDRGGGAVPDHRPERRPDLARAGRAARPPRPAGRRPAPRLAEGPRRHDPPPDARIRRRRPLPGATLRELRPGHRPGHRRPGGALRGARPAAAADALRHLLHLGHVGGPPLQRRARGALPRSDRPAGAPRRPGRGEARIAFAVERWGGSGAVFAWDLWNELAHHHGVPEEAGSVLPVETLSAIISDLSAHVRGIERRLFGKTHLQTVSHFGPEPVGALADLVFRHPDLDFATTHIYEPGAIDAPVNTLAAADAMARWVRHALSEIRDGRPFTDSETGPIHTFKDLGITLPEAFDIAYFRNMAWAHLASGGAGGGMRWPNRLPHTLTPGMRVAQGVMSDFARLIDWSRFAARNISEEIRDRAGEPARLRLRRPPAGRGLGRPRPRRARPRGGPPLPPAPRRRPDRAAADGTGPAPRHLYRHAQRPHPGRGGAGRSTWRRPSSPSPRSATTWPSRSVSRTTPAPPRGTLSRVIGKEKLSGEEMIACHQFTESPREL